MAVQQGRRCRPALSPAGPWGQSLYAVLGLTAAATPEDIKAQHRQLALRWHPDKWVAAAEAERAVAEETFKMVSAAYMVCGGVQRRWCRVRCGVRWVNGVA